MTAAPARSLARHSRALAAPLLLLPAVFAAWACAHQIPSPAMAAVAAPPREIAGFDVPFLFAYGSWEKRAKVENGRAVLRGNGLTPQGGAGVNADLDLAADADLSLAVRVRVGADNRMKTLRVLLMDRDQHTATYEFALPAAATEGFVTLTPRAGASLRQPNAAEKGPLDLAHVMQWQIQGDWQGAGPVDLEVEALSLVTPDAAARRERATEDARVSAEQQQAAREAVDLRAKYGARGAASPNVETVYAAAPDVLAVQIQAGRVIPSRLTDYAPQSGDGRRQDGPATILKRDGQEIGWLIGPKKDHLVTFERLEGDPLLEDGITDPAGYTVRSTDDPAFREPAAPVSVWRKSKPTDWAQPSRVFAMQHVLYFKLPKTLTPGRTYTVALGQRNTRQPEATLTFDPARVRSEAVHVNLVGFRPDDRPKRAFLSVWLGTGGAQAYPDGLTFRVVSDATGKTVYTGKVEKALAPDATEKLWTRTENFEKTGVYRMEFSDFKTPGRYRVVADGVGCSYPFDIGPKVWEKALQVQMQGFLNERSGVALGPPYTPFEKPRDFYPGADAHVYQSTFSILSGGDGSGEFEVAKHATRTPVPEAWGGWHDAGDWNPRRATHLRAAMQLLELAELFPDYYRNLKWALPGNAVLPPMLREPLFEVDLFHRLQKPDGGVPFGIETASDPIEGEVSWLQSMDAYVFAPDIWSSYLYAGTAGRLARLAAPYDARTATTYRASALKAMAWAEKERARMRQDGTLAKVRWEVKDSRNLAAVVLYDLTGDDRWHQVFLEDSCLKDADPKLFVWGDHIQEDAAFAYARLRPGRGDAALKQRAVRAMEAQAATALGYASGNAFQITQSDPGKPMFLGFFSTPAGATQLARAHYLTGKPEYLAGVVQAAQFSAGCNPNNITYTTGVGANPIRHPLHLDSRHTGQPAPAGITVYGNYDWIGWPQPGSIWPMTYYLGRDCRPSAFEWPLTEGYFDIYLFPMANELTIDQTMGPNAYIWGYLAARK